MANMTTGPRSSRHFPKIPSPTAAAPAHEAFLREITLRQVNTCPDLDRPGKKAFRRAIGIAKQVIGPGRLMQAFRGRFTRR